MATVATCGSGAGSPGSMVAAGSKNNVTSFQRRGPKASGSDSSYSRLVSIPGTRPSVRNGQLLVSTGLPALDQLLGWFGLTYKSLHPCERWASLENAKQ
uniref:Elongator complex protein 4 n=1 Tax=Suricata suricatta TaxID=37032 RepID=A0A673TTE8_SURSU